MQNRPRPTLIPERSQATVNGKIPSHEKGLATALVNWALPGVSQADLDACLARRGGTRQR